MKTLFVSLAALLFVFFVGCQSSITDPEVFDHTKFIGSSDEENYTYKDVFNYTYPNVIQLSGTLEDPSHNFNSLVKIGGSVRYGIREINDVTGIKSPVSLYKDVTPNKKFKIDLYVDAEFKVNCPNCNRPWIVKKATDKIVEVDPTNQMIVYFEKSFRVKNTCCKPLNLVLKFEVIKAKLNLVSMYLELANGIKASNSIE